MKNFIFLINIFVCLVSLAFAQTNKPILVADFNKLSVEQRRSFFNNLNPDLMANPKEDYISFVIQGLQDSDTRVRQPAAGLAIFIIGGLQDSKIKGQKYWMSIRDLPQLQSLLFNKINDPDAEVRGSAMMALAYSDAPNEKIESVLLERFAQETNADLRGAILESLANAGYDSDNFKQALVSALDDKSSRVLNKAANGIILLKPPQALPRLAQFLTVLPTNTTEDIYISSKIVDAIAAYGSEAIPYIPMIEKKAASLNPTQPPFYPSSPGTEKHLLDTIKKIKNPPPPDPNQKRFRTVALVEPQSQSSVSTTGRNPQISGTLSSSTTNLSTDQTVSTTTSQFNWMLVILIGLGAVVVGVVTYLLLKK